MEKIYFYCDESGAKGYADQNESKPGEVGVFAGILLPEKMIDKAEAILDPIADRYRPSIGKFHIAHLAPEQQEAIRDDIFAAIASLELPCFWYAIHVAGFRSWGQIESDLARQAHRDASQAFLEKRSTIKPQNFAHSPESLHVALFSGLFSRVVAYLDERGVTGASIEIHSDRVDTPIANKFDTATEELTKNDPVPFKAKGFDMATQKPVQQHYEISIELPSEFDFSEVITETTLVISHDVDGLGIAVDVLSNSLNYHFESRPPETLYGPLNDRAAVSSHPLFDCLDSFQNWGDGDLIADGIYKHPLAPH